ncbi:MAG: hypothetical protein ACT4OF_00385 [Caulobacteraceae bacterium]
MSAASLATALDADFEEVGDQRRTDRRTVDRRAARVKLDPLFAATLVNQIAKLESASARGYVAARRGPRPGIIMNVSA